MSAQFPDQVDPSTFSKTSGDTTYTATLRFHDNNLLRQILGDHDRHLVRLEQGIGIRMICRGNRIALSGPPATVAQAQTALQALYHQAEQGHLIDSEQVDGIIRLTARPDHGTSSPISAYVPAVAGTDTGHASYNPYDALPAIQTKRGVIAPRSHGQAAYMDALAKNALIFGIGPAGTGKTYLAVAQAVSMLLAGKVDRIILSRPAVEAGERLGFLPGDMREKIDPYLRPLYDALHDMIPAEQITRRLGNGEIEVAPLAFMRGRTLSNACVILDEAQNTTPAQMKMFLTRMGQNTYMAITGDISQIDLPPGMTSGLKDALGKLAHIKGISVCRMSSDDVVRHPLVARIVDAYDAKEPSKAPAYKADNKDGSHD